MAVNRESGIGIETQEQRQNTKPSHNRGPQRKTLIHRWTQMNADENLCGGRQVEEKNIIKKSASSKRGSFLSFVAEAVLQASKTFNDLGRIWVYDHRIKPLLLSLNEWLWSNTGRIIREE